MYRDQIPDDQLIDQAVDLWPAVIETMAHSRHLIAESRAQTHQRASALPHRGKSPCELLWTHGPVVCTSRAFRPDCVEVTLMDNGIVVEHATFPNATAAVLFASEKMRIYQEP